MIDQQFLGELGPFTKTCSIPQILIQILLEMDKLNPIALRRAKTQSFGHSECNRVKEMCKLFGRLYITDYFDPLFSVLWFVLCFVDSKRYALVTGIFPLEKGRINRKRSFIFSILDMGDVISQPVLFNHTQVQRERERENTKDKNSE